MGQWNRREGRDSRVEHKIRSRHMEEMDQIAELEHTCKSSYGGIKGTGGTGNRTRGQQECQSTEAGIGKRGIKHSIGRATPLAQGHPKTNNYLIDPEYRSPVLRGGSVSEWSVTPLHNHSCLLNRLWALSLSSRTRIMYDLTLYRPY